MLLFPAGALDSDVRLFFLLVPLGHIQRTKNKSPLLNSIPSQRDYMGKNQYKNLGMRAMYY